MAVPWSLGFLLILTMSPPTHIEPLYILVMPRVLRVGTPENIHVQAHSASLEPLKRSLEVNVAMWDFPLRQMLVAKSQLILSLANDFMVQTPVTENQRNVSISLQIPERLVYPPKLGQQYVVIRANWAATSDPSFMEKMVLVALHADYIFIQTDKPVYTPGQMVQYRVFAMNHKMDPVNRTFTLGIKNPEGVAITSRDLVAKKGLCTNTFQLPKFVRGRDGPGTDLRGEDRPDPYDIKFTRTPQHFKPGMPFHFRSRPPPGLPFTHAKLHPRSWSQILMGLRPLESSLAAKITVYSLDDGVATLPINTEAKAEQLHILMETGDSLWPKASAKMTVWPYLTQEGSGNFLHIEVKTAGTEILSQGRIVSAKRQLRSPGSDYTATIVNVTPEMLPSFRIVAFHLLPGLKVGLKNNEFIQTLEPSSQVHLKVTGDAEATVGLEAVDKAVYVLNSKHRLTQRKIWDTVEEHDPGCTVGSGRDRFAVFKGAGLDLKVSTGMYTPASSDWHCPQSPTPSRRRRSLKRRETKRNAVDNFTTELERRCCQAGLRESPVGLSCEKRARHVRHGPACVAAFRQCCQLSDPDSGGPGGAAASRDKGGGHIRMHRVGASPKADEDDDLDDLFEDNTPVRLCISEPFEEVVTKTFFVDLKLPLSVIKKEQVQIQAMLYNFRDRPVKVRVEFPYKEPLCSLSKSGDPHHQVVVVPPTASKMVPLYFSLLRVARQVGTPGYVTKGGPGGAQMGAGGQIERMFHILFDPQGLRGQTQTELLPRRDVPDTQVEVFVSVQGDILAETILGSLTPMEVQQLLRVPSGCPEQTLSKLAPVVLLMGYLDTTGQCCSGTRTHLNARWPTRHLPTALRRVPPGFTQMLSHQSRDGTFHVIKRRPGSTWCSRAVPEPPALPSCPPPQALQPGPPVKVLSLSSLCDIVRWIITQGQAEDGHFLEKGPVVMAPMQGGYKGSEADVSLTALVLVALREGKELCSPRVPNLDGSIRKACGFLETKLPHVLTTFAMAIASYALALAKSRLDSFASRDRTHWPVGSLPQNSLSPVEATAYALMQKLELGLHNDTDAINKWLLEKRELGGGFGSTQTTVVTLEALTRFSLAVPFEGIQDLQVQISTPSRSLNKRRLIDQNRARPALQHLQVPGAEDLEMKASGRGRGTISILTMYHRSPESWEDSCNMYHLNVTLQSAPEENKKGEETFRLRMETRFQGNRVATMTIMEI
ncbi:complement C3-like [Marmota flaviventris]|uniref:complement C3-like n=1 Tax=Marmota flaviventris TaxID=93162 RepID=UPI003A857661